LTHELQINTHSLESKAKEIERLNAELKQQQQALLKSHTECADTKARLFALNNDVDKLQQSSEQMMADKERVQQQLQTKLDEMDAAKAEQKQLQSEMADKSQALHSAERDITELRAKVSDNEHRWATLHAKYEALRAQSQELQSALDAKEDALLDADEKIEDVHLEAEREKKEVTQRLERKLAELAEATRALCELQSELEAKTSALSESEALSKEHSVLWAQLQSERDELQRANMEMRDAKESIGRELMGSKEKCSASEEKLKGTVRKLQEATLQNERLKDDLSAMQSVSENGELERKYAKLKEIVAERNELIETLSTELSALLSHFPPLI